MLNKRYEKYSKLKNNCISFLTHAEHQKRERQKLDNEEQLLKRYDQYVLDILRIKNEKMNVFEKKCREAVTSIKNIVPYLMDKDQLQAQINIQPDPMRWVLENIRVVEAGIRTIEKSASDARLLVNDMQTIVEAAKHDFSEQSQQSFLKRLWKFFNNFKIPYYSSSLHLEGGEETLRKIKFLIEQRRKEFKNAKKQIEDMHAQILKWREEINRLVNDPKYKAIKEQTGVELPMDMIPPAQSIEPGRGSFGKSKTFSHQVNTILKRQLGNFSIFLPMLNSNSCKTNGVNEVTGAKIPRMFPHQQVLRSVVNICARHYRMNMPEGYQAKKHFFSDQPGARSSAPGELERRLGKNAWNGLNSRHDLETRPTPKNIYLSHR